MKRSHVAAGFVLAAAIYEALAVWTNQFRTITELVEDAPSVVELVVVGGLLVWILDHFGWLDWLPWRHQGQPPVYEIRSTTSRFCTCEHEERHHDIMAGCTWYDCECRRFQEQHGTIDADPPPSPTRPDPGLSER